MTHQFTLRHLAFNGVWNPYRRRRTFPRSDVRTTVRIRVDAGRSCDYHLPVRLYRVVMRSGANMDVTAKLMLDDPTVSDSILFYQDETQHHLVATVVRSEVAGLILFPQKSTVTGRL